MSKVSGVVCTYNEEDNIAACIASMEGVDEVVVADDGSTDNTLKIAEKMGARTFRRHPHHDVATKADVAAFKKRFGWLPSFEQGTKINNGAEHRAEAIGAARYEWVLNLDADERVTWDLPKLKKEVMPEADQIICPFVHAHDDNGDPVRVSTNIKLFRKTATHIGGRTHDVILPGGRQVKSDLMRVDHWQKGTHAQSYVLPIMEYSVLKEDDDRSRFYLGRQYYIAGEMDRCIALMDLYLERSAFLAEIGQAHTYKARSLWESQRGDEARKEAMEAVLINPDHSEALWLLSEMYFEPWKSKWAFIAGNATDQDILF